MITIHNINLFKIDYLISILCFSVSELKYTKIESKETYYTYYTLIIQDKITLLVNYDYIC